MMNEEINSSDILNPTDESETSYGDDHWEIDAQMKKTGLTDAMWNNYMSVQGLITWLVRKKLRNTWNSIDPMCYVQADDLAHKAALRAAYHFEVEKVKSGKFSAYAGLCVERRLTQYIRAAKYRPPKGHTTGHHGGALPDLMVHMADMKTPPPDEPMSIVEERNRIRRIIFAVCDKREMKILFCMFGLDGGPMLSLEKTAQRVGNLSKERVRQIKEAAFEKIRSCYGESPL